MHIVLWPLTQFPLAEVSAPDAKPRQRYSATAWGVNVYLVRAGRGARTANWMGGGSLEVGLEPLAQGHSHSHGA